MTWLRGKRPLKEITYVENSRVVEGGRRRGLTRTRRVGVVNLEILDVSRTEHDEAVHLVTWWDLVRRAAERRETAFCAP